MSIYSIQARVIGTVFGAAAAYESHTKNKAGLLQSAITGLIAGLSAGGFGYLSGRISQNVIGFAAKKIAFDALGTGASIAGGSLQFLLTGLFLSIIGKILSSLLSSLQKQAPNTEAPQN